VEWGVVWSGVVWWGRGILKLQNIFLADRNWEVVGRVCVCGSVGAVGYVTPPTPHTYFIKL